MSLFPIERKFLRYLLSRLSVSAADEHCTGKGALHIPSVDKWQTLSHRIIFGKTDGYSSSGFRITNTHSVLGNCFSRSIKELGMINHHCNLFPFSDCWMQYWRVRNIGSAHLIPNSLGEHQQPQYYQGQHSMFHTLYQMYRHKALF